MATKPNDKKFDEILKHLKEDRYVAPLIVEAMQIHLQATINSIIEEPMDRVNELRGEASLLKFWIEKLGS